MGDEADEAFAARLEAHGYYDVLEVQYKDWLSDERLSAEDRVQKAQGLIALYTRLGERATEERDRKKYHQLAMEQIEQLKKQAAAPALALGLDMSQAKLLLDEARAMGQVGPPVVNEEGEQKPSPAEQAWDKVLALYAKIGKEASAAWRLDGVEVRA